MKNIWIDKYGYSKVIGLILKIRESILYLFEVKLIVLSLLFNYFIS